MPRAPRTTARAKPHSRAAQAARDAAAMGGGPDDPDQAWAARIRERLLGACHPFQLQAALDPALRISLLVGRGGAKTTTKRVRALLKMTTRRRARIAYVATSRPEAERLNWEPMKELLEQLGEMDHFEFAEQKMRCTCKRTGATYQFFGADDKREINKLRGQPFDEFQVDETASFDPALLENMIDRAVGPRLGERNGCIVLGGTPGHLLYGLFYDVTRPGSELHRPYALRDAPEFAGWIGWSSHTWDVPEILAADGAAERYPALAANWAAALVEKERKKWSDDNPIWLREYRGRWAADNTTTMYAYRPHDADGAPLNQWDPLGWSASEWASYEALPFGEQARAAVAMVKTAVAKLPPVGEWLFGYGMDLGSRDPFALNIGAFSAADPERRVFHVGCFGRRKMYARLIAELLIGPEAVEQALRGEVYSEVAGLFGITGWPPSLVADLAGLGETLIDELANVYGVRIKAAHKAGKFGAIEVVNGDLADRRMLILAGSPLEEQLATLQWRPDEHGQPKEDRSARNDHADSWTYFRTDVGQLLGAAPPPAEETDRKPNPKAQTRKRDDWPAPRRPRGEFDALLGDDDWNALR